jgi:hypothetical protein
MFHNIEKVFVESLQKHLDKIPKDRISVLEPKDPKYLPAVSVNNVSFEVSEVGLGGTLHGEEVKIMDLFTGDDETTEFQLTQKPLKPIQRIEHPIGTIVSSDKYVVDYQLNRVIFHSPPSKGEKNISIRYLKPMISKGIKLDIIYHIKVYSTSISERDKIAVECIKALIYEEAYLRHNEIFFRAIRGFNKNPPELKDVYCKVLEYLVEGKIQVETPHPRIEKIDLNKES